MFTVFKPLFLLIQSRFNKFIDRRMPIEQTHRLSHKNIFIFPSWFGLVFISFALLLFVIGTNYQNNLILLVSFFIVSLFTVVMLHSYDNLAGLVIRSSGTLKGFVGHPINMPVNFTRIKNKRAFFVKLSCPEPLTIEIACLDNKTDIPVIFPRRGVYRAERLQLSSEFPLGVFRTWTYLKFPITFIVYPEPKPCQLPNVKMSIATEEGDAQAKKMLASGEDFYELRDYRQGESLSQVAWKQVAKGQEWKVKRYANSVTSEQNLLKLSEMPAGDIELKLSYLCYLVLEFHNAKLTYGLDLGSHIIKIDSGEEHLNQCLEALARWQSS